MTDPSDELEEFLNRREGTPPKDDQPDADAESIPVESGDLEEEDTPPPAGPPG